MRAISYELDEQKSLRFVYVDGALYFVIKYFFYFRGQYTYGYSGGPSAKIESKTVDGITRGTCSNLVL